MFIRGALDELFSLQRVEAIEGGFVGDDLTSSLDFANQRRAMILAQVLLDELKDSLLFVCKRKFTQRGTSVVGDVPT